MQIEHNLDFTNTERNIKGFQEAVFSVSNLHTYVEFFTSICGWKQVHRGRCDNNMKQLWHLDDQVEIEEVLMQNAGDNEGFIRLVSFKNVDQVQIRSAAQTWDWGGIFDVNIRTNDMDAFYRATQNAGWSAYADPLRYTFGKYDVSEVLLRGPDGITIAAMERFSPPLVGFPHMKKTSRLFNSSIVTNNMAESYDFYIHKLGFQMFFQTAGDARKAGKNVLGIPPNINKDITVPVDIVRPDIDNFGSIEYLELKELEGKDCSSLAKPPNLGILMLRFPVRDAEKYANQLMERDVTLNSELHTVELLPYGKVKIFSIRTPEGVWLEFMELIK